MDEQLLKALENIGLELVLLKLCSYAKSRIIRINDSYGDRPLFEVSECSEFALEAYRRAIDSHYNGRNWDGKINPTAHLCGVIKSLISSEVTKRKKLYQPSVVGDVVQLVDYNDPESILIEAERNQKIKAVLDNIEKDVKRLKRGVDDIIDDVFFAMLELGVVYPKDIAEFHDITLDSAKTLKRRIGRVITKHK